MVYRGFAKSVIGSREMNQDSVLVNNDRGLFAVADGVGGGVGGSNGVPSGRWKVKPPDPSGWTCPPLVWMRRWWVAHNSTSPSRPTSGCSL